MNKTLSQIQAESAARLAFPHVPSPGAQGSTNKQFGLHAITIAGGQSFPKRTPGNTVYVLSIRTSNFEMMDAGTIYVRTSNGDQVPLDVFQRGYKFDRPFEGVEFFNTGGAGLTALLRVYIGFGDYQDDSTDIRVSPIPVSSLATFGTANTAAYTPGHNVGGVMVFDNVAKYVRCGGKIKKARLTLNACSSILNSSFTLYLFDGTPTYAIADRTAFGLDGASSLLLIGVINFPTLANFAALGVGVGGLQAGYCMVDGIDIQYFANRVGTTGPAMSGALVANGAFDPDAAVTWSVLLTGEAHLPGYVEPATVYSM